MVYTSEMYRNQGYATALVVAVGQQLFNDNGVYFLYCLEDPNIPTRNYKYLTEVGFRLDEYYNVNNLSASSPSPSLRTTPHHAQHSQGQHAVEGGGDEEDDDEEGEYSDEEEKEKEKQREREGQGEEDTKESQLEREKEKEKDKTEPAAPASAVPSRLVTFFSPYLFFFFLFVYLTIFFSLSFF